MVFFHHHQRQLKVSLQRLEGGRYLSSTMVIYMYMLKFIPTKREAKNYFQTSHQPHRNHVQIRAKIETIQHPAEIIAALKAGRWGYIQAVKHQPLEPVYKEIQPNSQQAKVARTLAIYQARCIAWAFGDIW